MNLKYSFFVLGLIVAAEAQQGYQRENPSDRLAYDSPSERYNEEENPTGNEIPGEAGKDYPIFGAVPETRFDCGQQQLPGYYADTEAGCQVFHICQIGGRKDSFLCPNGTIFNQEKFVCDWWFDFDCSQAQNFYSINEAIVRAMEEADRLAAEKNSADGYRYNTPSDSRKQSQQRPSSANAPQSDFDSVVIEAARIAPRGKLSQSSHPQGEIYNRPEAPRRQPSAGTYAEENLKSSRITGATFGKQLISAAPRDNEAGQDQPGGEYLPARAPENNKY